MKTNISLADVEDDDRQLMPTTQLRPDGSSLTTIPPPMEKENGYTTSAPTATARTTAIRATATIECST